LTELLQTQFRAFWHTVYSWKLATVMLGSAS